MQPDNSKLARQYQLVARTITFIRENANQQPTLEDISAAVHVSPFHLQRLFAEWAGLSPKRFLQYLTKEYAKKKLKSSQNVLSVSESAGLSSTSRLHDLMVTCEAMTPGEIQSGGAGQEILFGFAESPFGEVIVGRTPRGICHFAFSDTSPDAMKAELFSSWPHAKLCQDDQEAQTLMNQIFPSTPTRGNVHLVLRGTNFQIKVWEALINTEFARVVSYQQLAQQAGFPKAQRAVGSTLAANPIGFLIPCHRVIRESGIAGNYRWGTERKLAMLAWEAGKAQQPKPPIR